MMRRPDEHESEWREAMRESDDEAIAECMRQFEAAEAAYDQICAVAEAHARKCVLAASAIEAARQGAPDGEIVRLVRRAGAASLRECVRRHAAAREELTKNAPIASERREELESAMDALRVLNTYERGSA